MGRPTLESFTARLADTPAWPAPSEWEGLRAVEECVAAVTRRLTALGGVEVTPRDLAGVVARLRRGEQLHWGDLRLCAFGLTVAIEGEKDGRRIIDDPDLVGRLGPQLYSSMQDRRSGRRLAIGIAKSIVFPTEAPGVEARRHLRTFGAAAVHWAREHGSSDDAQVAGMLRDGAEFFTGLDTAPFHEYMRTGDRSALALLDALEAPSNSWARVEAIIGGLQGVLSGSDREVRSHVAAYLERLSEFDGALDQGLGMLLRRWLRLKGRPEQALLRDAATDRWRSPLDEKAHLLWHSHTGEPARQMVAQWITRRAIVAFFSLAGSGSADQDRLDFWRRYAESITGFRFYLGARDWPRRTVLREQLGAVVDDRTIVRPFAEATMNAFMMEIRAYVFVEFSETDNALYVYSRGDLPAGFDRARPRRQDLKDTLRSENWIRHRGNWQKKVRELIQELTGETPT